MFIFKTAKDIGEYLDLQRAEGKKIGFVPTMGALHDGHLSLVRKCKAENEVAVCSIFINPTQFNDKKDFALYPVSIEDDLELLLSASCDVLFLPSVDEIYPNGVDAIRAYDFAYLETILEGASRPGHFRGVGQVVGRLLEIVVPNNLYMGAKDYQQCMVVRSLLQQMGMMGVTMHVCPTAREQDGLAMSSRNRRLTDAQRISAVTIYQCLVSIQAKMSSDSFSIVHKECIELLIDKGFKPDYVVLANAETLAPMNEYDPNVPMVALIAASIGEVRLIDNMVL